MLLKEFLDSCPVISNPLNYYNEYMFGVNKNLLICKCVFWGFEKHQPSELSPIDFQNPNVNIM